MLDWRSRHDKDGEAMEDILDEYESEIERLKRLLKQRGKDAADAEDEIERLKLNRG